MAIELKDGIHPLTVMKDKLPEQMINDKTNSLFKKYYGDSFENFYSSLLNVYITLLEALEKNPDLENFSNVSVKFKQARDSINKLKEIFGNYEDCSAFISLVETPFNIASDCVNSYRKNKFN